MQQILDDYLRNVNGDYYEERRRLFDSTLRRPQVYNNRQLDYISRLFDYDLSRDIPMDGMYLLSVIGRIQRRIQTTFLDKPVLDPKRATDDYEKVKQAVLNLHAMLSRSDREILAITGGIMAGGSVLLAFRDLHTVVNEKHSTDRDVYFDDEIMYEWFLYLHGFTNRSLEKEVDELGNLQDCYINVSKRFFVMNGILKRYKQSQYDVILCKDVETTLINFDLTFCNVRFNGASISGNVRHAITKTGLLTRDYIPLFIHQVGITVHRIQKYMRKGYVIQVDLPDEMPKSIVIEADKETRREDWILCLIKKRVLGTSTSKVNPFAATGRNKKPVYDLVADAFKQLELIVKVLPRYNPDMEIFLGRKCILKHAKTRFITDFNWGTKFKYAYAINTCPSSIRQVELDEKTIDSIESTETINYITLENQTVADHLNEDPGNFVSLIDGRYYASNISYLKQAIDDTENYVFACQGEMLGVPERRNIDESQIYVYPFIEQNTLIPLSCAHDMKMIVEDGTSRVFALENRVEIPSTTALNNIIVYRAEGKNIFDRQVNIVGANHCDSGSGRNFFSVVAYMTVKDNPQCSLM